LRDGGGSLIRFANSLALFVFLLLFLSSCQLQNFLNCGSFHDCRDDSDLQNLLILGLLSRDRGGPSIPAFDGSGAVDRAEVYNSSPGRISDAEWDEAAVRRVLHAFAYGGGTTDAQIKAWADMTPGEAIIEILSMRPLNPKLNLAYEGGRAPVGAGDASLSRLANYFAAGNFANNPRDFSTRQRWGNSPGHTWLNAVRLRGVNPVRQRIGLFETNYHMAVNLDKNVNPQQMVIYYDLIANDIARGKPYHEVIRTATLSAAVATQYNHRKNVFRNGAFEGNEDFAREYHQLFFGILGTGIGANDEWKSADCNKTPTQPCQGRESFDDHENITIRQTAEALTGIEVEGRGNFLPVHSKFVTTTHSPGLLQIYGEKYGGANAQERFNQLTGVSINHPESLYNLPLIIVKGLADENLDPDVLLDGCTGACNASSVRQKIQRIRSLWTASTATNGQINLIEFLRRYAISDAFHNPSRIQFLDSITRNMIVANQVGVSNQEVGRDINQSFWRLQAENIIPFRPEHDVFGGQTGLEAANTDNVFIQQYNSVANRRPGAIGFWNGSRTVSIKNFRKLLEREFRKKSDFKVQDVAEFLWRRITADHNLTFFTPGARLQVYSLLANGNDFLFFKDKDCRVQPWNCTNQSLNTTTTINTADLNLSNPTDDVRGLRDTLLFRPGQSQEELQRTNERVGYAIDFIAATPFAFVQTGQ